MGVLIATGYAAMVGAIAWIAVRRVENRMDLLLRRMEARADALETILEREFGYAADTLLEIDRALQYMERKQ